MLNERLVENILFWSIFSFDNSVYSQAKLVFLVFFNQRRMTTTLFFNTHILKMMKFPISNSFLLLILKFPISNVFLLLIFKFPISNVFLVLARLQLTPLTLRYLFAQNLHHFSSTLYNLYFITHLSLNWSHRYAVMNKTHLFLVWAILFWILASIVDITPFNKHYKFFLLLFFSILVQCFLSNNALVLVLRYSCSVSFQIMHFYQILILECDDGSKSLKKEQFEFCFQLFLK